MVMGKMTYEECRQKRVEENKKRMEALNLPKLSQAVKHFSTSLKPSPMKHVKPRTVEKTLVAVRRSSRIASNPAPVYVEVAHDRLTIPRRVSRPRDLNRVYASDKVRTATFEKAEEIYSELDSSYPAFVKSMLPSHVSGCYWLGLQVHFCKKHMPKNDTVMTLIDEDGDEYPTIYLPRKTGLSGGWKGFSDAHHLSDGDALVFQLTKPATFKVYLHTCANRFLKASSPARIASSTAMQDFLHDQPTLIGILLSPFSGLHLPRG